MPLNLSLTTTLEKNKLSSDGAWLLLLEIRFLDEIIRLVRNTDIIIWKGFEWLPFPFELEDLKEDAKGEIPSLKIKVGNHNRQMQRYLDALDGAIGAVAFLRVVHSEHLNIYEPDLELQFSVESSEVDQEWVYFSLGGDNTNATRYPNRRIIKDFCPYQYKKIECGYIGTMPACPKTLNACRARGNEERFGGEFSIPISGIYASNN